MAAETTYQLNDAPKLTVAFTVGGVATDPTTVTATVRKPDGTSTNYTVTAGQIVKDSTGNYHLVVAADVAGRWSYKFAGTGTVVDTEQGVFYVIPDWTVSNPTFYLTAGELKSTLSMGGFTAADVDVSVAIIAASRAIDNLCERHFWADAADVTRYYSPNKPDLLDIDDLVSLTSLASDDDGTYAYPNAWVQNTDFLLEPLNAPTENPALPWTRARLHPNGQFRFNTFYPRSVKVVGKFGWPAVPDGIVQATGMLATRIMRLSREAPFGVVAFDGGAIRIARMDSNVMALIGPYMKHRVAVG